MCIAILKRKGSREITPQELQNCWTKNPHGFGCMYQLIEGKKTRVAVYKTMDEKTALAFAEDIQKKENVGDIGFHFRIATHGTTDVDNCHPFDAGQGMQMLHNGMLSLHDCFGKKSDTRILAEMLRGVKMEWWKDDQKMKELEKFTTGSKLVFMSPKQSFIVHEKSGHEVEGVWFSNYSYRTWEYTQPKSKKNEPYKGGGWNRFDEDNDHEYYKKWQEKNPSTHASKQGTLPVDTKKSITIKKPSSHAYNVYKSAIQGHLTKDQRQDLNLLTEEENNLYWEMMLGYMPGLIEQLEKIKDFYDFVCFPNTIEDAVTE